MKHLILLQCTFFHHVREGRHKHLHAALLEYKETATAICYAPDVIWHDVHFSLSYVLEELKNLLHSASEAVSHFIHQAISFTSCILEHAGLRIKHPQVTQSASADISNASVLGIARAGKLTKKQI